MLYGLSSSVMNLFPTCRSIDQKGWSILVTMHILISNFQKLLHLGRVYWKYRYNHSHHCLFIPSPYCFSDALENGSFLWQNATLNCCASHCKDVGRSDVCWIWNIYCTARAIQNQTVLQIIMPTNYMQKASISPPVILYTYGSSVRNNQVYTYTLRRDKATSSPHLL